MGETEVFDPHQWASALVFRERQAHLLTEKEQTLTLPLTEHHSLAGPVHPPVQAPGVPYKGQAVTSASGERRIPLVSEVQRTLLMETNLAPAPRLGTQLPLHVVAKSSGMR